MKTIFKNLSIIFFTSTVLVAIPIKAFCAGFAVDSHSVSGLANSHAGEASGAHDISNSYANPAVLADIKTPHLILSGSYVNVNIDDDNGSSDIADPSRNNNAGVNALVPAFHFARPINDKLTAGVSVTVPFALATKYDANWVGQKLAVDSEILSTNINPMIAYKVNSQLSIGGGLMAQYIKARFTTNAAKVKGDDWGYGFNLGVKYKLNDKLQFGAGYRSAIKHKIAGQTDSMSLIIASSSPLITPEIINLGVAYNLTQKTTLLHDTSWTRWSRIKSLDVNTKNLQLNSTKYNWQDSFRFSFGANHQLCDKWQIRSGVAFEQGASGSYRNPRVPEGDKFLASVGFGYKISDNLSTDFAYMHQFFKKTTNNLIEGPLKTDYKVRVDVLAIAAKYQF